MGVNEILNALVACKNKKLKSLLSGKVVNLKYTSDSSNKFCKMTDNDDGTMSVEEGELGEKSKITNYNISKWNSIYKLKTRLGFKDITELTTDYDSGDASDIDKSSEDKEDEELLELEREFNNLITKLRNYANKVITTNAITSVSITRRMVDKAQEILDELSNMNLREEGEDIKAWIEKFNKCLLELFTNLPRDFKNITLPKNVRKRTVKPSDFFLNIKDGSKVNNDKIMNNAKDIINREQEILDSVSINLKDAKVNSSGDVNRDKRSFLAEFGIELRAKDAELENKVKSMLRDVDSRSSYKYNYVNCWYVVNSSTLSAYESDKAKAAEIQDGFHHDREMILWHGSPNENWLSIVKTGVNMAHASNGMFGKGLYFADRSTKSVNYTSARGAYWSHGNDSTFFLGLFRVRVGKRYHAKTSGNYDYKKIKSLGDYDSVFGEKGQSLINNEFIVYRDAQTTIYALVELHAK